MTFTDRSRAAIEPIQISPLWLAYRIRFEARQENADSPKAVSSFLTRLSHLLIEGMRLNREVFLHSWKLHENGTGTMLEENLRAWNPIPGLGVWPNRKPPSRWTPEAFMDAAAAMLKNQEPQLSSYRLLHLDTEPEVRSAAVSQLLGRQVLMQLFLREAAARLFERAKDTFLPLVTDTAFKYARFYAPLFESKTIHGATDEQLSLWMCGAEVCIRESPEDQGVLILLHANMQKTWEDAMREEALTMR